VPLRAELFERVQRHLLESCQNGPWVQAPAKFSANFTTWRRVTGGANRHFPYAPRLALDGVSSDRHWADAALRAIADEEDCLPASVTSLSLTSRLAFAVEDDVVNRFFRKFSHLTCVELRNLGDDDVLHVLATQCGRTLRSLTVEAHEYEAISEDGVLDFVEALGDECVLECLDFSSCFRSKMGWRGFRALCSLPMLTTLSLSFRLAVGLTDPFEPDVASLRSPSLMALAIFFESTFSLDAAASDSAGRWLASPWSRNAVCKWRSLELLSPLKECFPKLKDGTFIMKVPHP